VPRRIHRKLAAWVGLAGILLCSPGCALLSKLPIPGLKPRIPGFEEGTAQATPTPVPTPIPAPTPPPRTGPSSDEVWLVEMMAQRLEIAALEAWSLPESPSADDIRNEAYRHALVVQSSRIGLPAQPAAAFFDAQMEAAADYRDELRELWKNPRNRPTAPVLPLSTIDSRRDAIDLQILATFRRLGGIPYGRDLHKLTIKTLEERGFKKSIAKIAARTFLPSS
jgi:hypothetical protein